ncbi:YqhA family protein [Psychrobacter sp. APC 3426]|uniref:YqhA family protein n=1 Tax=Psychrobacter sp. APC 3426 TaxID=3035177 RepID=UPI0025B41A2E|nr:YqhA family protein [Psychrobacter sp. APC 3426]MDN3399796.1 YqhA family protein [Psychrobacter sp. APC 3426]
MLKNIERYLEKTIFNSRWILAPFYLGLILGIVLLFIKFIQKTIMMFNTVFNPTLNFESD